MHQITILGLQLSLETIILAAGAILSLAGAVAVSRRRAHARKGDLPPLVFEVRDRPEPELRPMSVRPPEPTPQGLWRGAGGMRWDAPPAPPAPPRRAAAEGYTVRMPRFHEPAREYLPGRLVVESGGEIVPGEELRFVRRAGDVADVTLGRGDGPAHSHVKLPVETVSRRHARMRFEDGRWQITNLSRTNPTLVNGEELLASEGARVLEDGDLIEMGEMVFRFRAH
ncbi:MAG TPA: FHA domain-containing protein [Gemmatimonadaceae bacterium]